MNTLIVRHPYGMTRTVTVSEWHGGGPGMDAVHRRMIVEHLRDLELHATHGDELIVEFHSRLIRTEDGPGDHTYEWSSTVTTGEPPTEIEA